MTPTLQAATLKPATLRGGPGIFQSTRGGKAVLEVKPTRRSSAKKSDHPFLVLTRAKPNVPAITQAGVIYESSLFKSLRPNDKKSITGLLDEDRENGWFDMIGNDAIWLGVTFDSSGVPDWAGIDSWGQSDTFEIDEDAWSENNGYCEDDGGDPAKHQTSRKLIAYSVAGESGKPILTQVMFHDQVLRNVCIDGRPARYPFAHEGGYPL